MFKSKASCLTVLIVALLLTVSVIGIYGFQLANTFRLKSQCTKTTTGYVYTYPSTAKMKPLFYSNAGARYEVDGAKYLTSGRDSRSHNKDEEIKVHYDPSDPSVAYCGTSPKRLDEVFVVLFTFAGVMTCVAALKSLKRIG